MTRKSYSEHLRREGGMAASGKFSEELSELDCPPMQKPPLCRCVSGHHTCGAPNDKEPAVEALRSIHDLPSRADLLTNAEALAMYEIASRTLDELADARSALRYIEQRYGRLDGVGWGRVLGTAA